MPDVGVLSIFYKNNTWRFALPLKCICGNDTAMRATYRKVNPLAIQCLYRMTSGDKKILKSMRLQPIQTGPDLHHYRHRSFNGVLHVM
jgi:hypothetical protein